MGCGSSKEGLGASSDPWEMAARGQARQLERWLDMGGNPSALDRQGGRGTLLHAAAQHDRVDCIQVLLNQGADVNAVTKLRGSPLHAAAAHSTGLCVRVLLDKGADPLLKNAEGASAIDVAAAYGYAAMVDVMRAAASKQAAKRREASGGLYSDHSGASQPHGSAPGTPMGDRHAQQAADGQPARQPRAPRPSMAVERHPQQQHPQQRPTAHDIGGAFGYPQWNAQVATNARPEGAPPRFRGLPSELASIPGVPPPQQQQSGEAQQQQAQQQRPQAPQQQQQQQPLQARVSPLPPPQQQQQPLQARVSPLPQGPAGRVHRGYGEELGMTAVLRGSPTHSGSSSPYGPPPRVQQQPQQQLGCLSPQSAGAAMAQHPSPFAEQGQRHGQAQGASASPRQQQPQQQQQQHSSAGSQPAPSDPFLERCRAAAQAHSNGDSGSGDLGPFGAGDSAPSAPVANPMLIKNALGTPPWWVGASGSGSAGGASGGAVPIHSPRHVRTPTAPSIPEGVPLTVAAANGAAAGHQAAGHQPAGHQAAGHQPAGHQAAGHQPPGHQAAGHQAAGGQGVSGTSDSDHVNTGSSNASSSSGGGSGGNLLLSDPLLNWVNTHIKRQDSLAAAGPGGPPTPGAHPLPGPERSASNASGFLSGASQGTLFSQRSSAMVDIKPWEIDYDDLVIQRPIGEGSFGKVYLAKWNETLVAVKLLLSLQDIQKVAGPEAALTLSSPVLFNLQKECQLMAGMRHPNIVQFMGVSAMPPSMVTEYCGKGSLTDVLRGAKSNPKQAQLLSWARRINLALDAAKGMLYLHKRGIIHRDLKSPNLLVDSTWRVKIADFNLSKIIDVDGQNAKTGTMAGANPKWLAPEVIAGQPATCAGDVFSFGVVLWELLTWSIPWQKQSPWTVVAQVLGGKRLAIPPPDELPGSAADNAAFAPHLPAYCQLIKRCWEQDQGERPEFEEIIKDLRKLLQEAQAASAARAQQA